MAGTATVILDDAVDTYADNGSVSYQTKKRHTSIQLLVDSGERESFVYFPAPAPLGATIISAKLRLYTRGSWGGAAPTITVRRVGTKYVASQLDWTNRPTTMFGATITGSHASTGDNDLWEFDVTVTMQEVANGGAWYGFRLTSSSTTPLGWHSANGTGTPPQLEVSWSEAPDAPTTLNPSGGQQVSIAKPVLEGDYTDVSGSTTLANVQVHLKTTNTGWTDAAGFSSPTFDSGAVVATGSKATLDLATTAYAGLSAGSTIYWTMRVQDSAGIWSKYSVPTSFGRTAKGTLTITSPSSGTPVVNDYTPPIVTTFTGATAEKHRLFVQRLDTLAEVYDSGDVPGTGLQETPQAANGRAVLQTGISYRATWRTYDTVNRAVTLGDPDYVEATRDFTVVAGATAAATSPVGSVVNTPPGYTLTVTSTTAPDQFTWLLDGKEVDTDIPSAYAVGGTSYAYTFTGFRPGVSHTFAVARVIGGVAGPVASVTATVRVPGVWLVDPKDRTTYLFIAKTGGSSFVLREEGETMFALGAQKGVRITEALGGYGGDVSGVLVAQYGKTLQEWVDLALKIRSRPGRPYMLIAGTEGFECVVWNVNVRPTGDSSPTMRDVSFSFGQTDDQRVPVYL